MSTLTNVFADLQRFYGENIRMSYASPPSYLSTIVGDEGKIVFIYELNSNQIESITTAPSNKLNLTWKDEHDLNLTGSPLKDDCIVDTINEFVVNNPNIGKNWSFEEECQKGIKMDKACRILYEQNLQRSYTEQSLGSIWTLCNNSGIRNPLLLLSEISQNNFGRGVITYLGASPTSSVNMQSLLKQHLTPIAANLPVNTSIENTYEISRDMFLRCSLVTTNALPLLIDLSPSCEVVLLQTVISKEIGASTQYFFNQLCILSFIREEIIIFKEAEKHNLNKEPIYQCGCGIDSDELRECIYKIMTDICDQNEVNNKELESDFETIIQRAEMRRLSDLTDKFWDLFTRCSSYKDLKYAFNVLFNYAARCTIVNTPTNNNHLANIIIEISNKRLAIPCLSGSEPLELLLEIGLEKLFKDYEYIFTESKICSAAYLKPQCNDDVDMDNNIPDLRKSLRFAFPSESKNSNKNRKTFLHSKNVSSEDADYTVFKNSYFSVNETGRRLSRLCQIHFTLEHLYKIHLHLNLRTNVYADVCQQLLKKPKQKLTRIDATLEDKQLISIATHEVREYLEGKIPNSRRITMISNNKFREVKTIFYYNMGNIFPPAASENFDDKTLTKESFYYSWFCRTEKTFK